MRERIYILDYRWYDKVRGDDIQQGDIIESCPVLILPSELSFGPSDTTTESQDIPFECRDVIVMSQTCDMVKGQEKIPEVLLCGVWHKSDFEPGQRMASNDDWEKARKGQWPAFHVLDKCELEGLKRDFRVVDFRRVHSLPLDFVRNMANELGDRIRLLPPFREHLSQAFARFFMRVGLPVDIPPFT
jgi:hypothetical protein